MDVPPTYNGKPVYYIDNEASLIETVGRLAQFPEMGVDTEFDKNRNSFGFNLCVLQISVSDAIYLIDPIKICHKDKFARILKPFFDLMASPQILKIMHACSEDIRLFAKYHCIAQNIFDTRMAAKVLGIALADSYKGVVKEVLDFDLDKSQQSINWLKRPLQQRDMIYLAGDVFYLPALKEKLMAELERTGRMLWVNEETEITLGFDRNTDFDYDITNVLAKLGYRNLSEYNKALFEAMWKFRGDYAKALNVPPYYIFTDEQIYEFVEVPQWDLSTPMDGVYKKLAQTDKKQWVDFVNGIHARLTANNLSKEPPQKKHLTPDEKIIHSRKQYIALKDFEPIQNYLTNIYGETISRYLLSKTTIGKIAAAGSLNILPRYVVAEIMKAAEATGADLSAYPE